jgi:hypothetical protein
MRGLGVEIWLATVSLCVRRASPRHCRQSASTQRRENTTRHLSVGEWALPLAKRPSAYWHLAGTTDYFIGVISACAPSHGLGPCIPRLSSTSENNVANLATKHVCQVCGAVPCCALMIPLKYSSARRVIACSYPIGALFDAHTSAMQAAVPPHRNLVQNPESVAISSRKRSKKKTPP